MKNKIWMKALVIVGALLSCFGIASAHVSVSPKVSTTGIEETYTVRVPVEKNSNTVKVEVVFPEGVDVDSVEPIQGWSYAFKKDSTGNNTSVIWNATAGGIKPNEFMLFSFIGANPKKAGDIAWKAYQTYADGSVVEWTGAPGSDTPASVTQITAGTGEEDHHDENKSTTTLPQQQQTAAGKETTATTTTSNTVPYVISGVALLLSLISLFRKRA